MLKVECKGHEKTNGKLLSHNNNNIHEDEDENTKTKPRTRINSKKKNENEEDNDVKETTKLHEVVPFKL